MSKDKNQKHLSLVVLFLCLLFSCVENIEDSSITDNPITKSANEAISIVNDAKNTSWYIGSSNVADIEPMTIGYNDTIVLDDVEKADTIVFNGGVQSNGLWLFEGVMYAPFSRVVSLSACRDSLGNRLIYPIGFDVNVNNWK